MRNWLSSPSPSFDPCGPGTPAWRQYARAVTFAKSDPAKAELARNRLCTHLKAHEQDIPVWLYAIDRGVESGRDMTEEIK